jgi:NodT family efflux transporter outer membrane factor (OMF) lipoprotein
MIKLGAVLTVILVMAGCTVGPNYAPPKNKVPPAWSGLTGPSSNALSVVTADAARLEQWWRKFQDPKLTELVGEALRANLDIQVAEASLRQARASRGVVAGGLWPSLSSSAWYERQGTASIPNNSYSAGLDAAWELDIFGGVRRNLESADASIQAAQENLRDVQVTLASEVALNYLQLRGSQEQIAIAEENIKAQQHTAGLTRQRRVAGFASGLDVVNADAQVATTTSSIPVLQTTLQQAIYSLSVLLGRAPADLLNDLEKPGPVPVTPPEIPAGLPSDLLRRRPDVRAAEARLHAATAQIGVATSDLFPKFSLTGSVNYQSSMLKKLFDNQSYAWALEPQATWSIFQGGSLVSNVRLKEALRDEAGVTYQKTVLTALQEVENALIAFTREWDHRKALSDAEADNRKALDLSTELYTQGTTDFLSVLTAERSLYGSQTALAQSKLALSTDLVAIYKALGGGWEDDKIADFGASYHH